MNRELSDGPVMLRICGKLLYLSSSNLESFPVNSHNRLTQGPLITKNYSATELTVLPLTQKMTSFTFSPCGNFSKFCLFRGDQLFLCMLQNIFSHRPPLEKSKQKFLISSKKAEFTEVPAGWFWPLFSNWANARKNLLSTNSLFDYPQIIDYWWRIYLIQLIIR